ncbi:MAG: ribosome modulation factor [Flavobacteriales bacterium]|jgi:ribosome modulation factor
MKRQKRDRCESALTRGYQAGYSGCSRDRCPHEGGEARHQWFSGWREGREDLWNGYNTLASVHKANNLQMAV